MNKEELMKDRDIKLEYQHDRNIRKYIQDYENSTLNAAKFYGYLPHRKKKD